MKDIQILLKFFLPTVPMFLGVTDMKSLCVFCTTQNSKEYFIRVLVSFCCDKHYDLKQLRKSSFQLTTYNQAPKEIRRNNERKS